jgi:O-antigen ligase
VPLAVLPLMLVALNKATGAIGRLSPEMRMLGLILFVLLASTFVWRARATQSLDSNPLDTAASTRVLLVSLAALLAFAFLTHTRSGPTSVPVSLRWLSLYVVAAAVSALGSPLPLQALYRAYELGVGLLAAAVALSIRPARPGWTLARLMLYGSGSLVALIWIEALIHPSGGFVPTPGIFPYTLQGYLPSFSSNSVGTFGGVLAILGLARDPLTSNGLFRSSRVALVAGVVTLLAAQYRTGIIAFLVAIAVMLWQRNRYMVMAAAIAAVFAVSIFGGWASLVGSGQKVFAKGRPEQVHNLDSRTEYWKAALPLIRERPVLGWGLNVGSRRVLSTFDQTISTIHSTWVEALLGTGLIGSALLLLAFLAALCEGWMVRADPLGNSLLGVIVFISVRTLTGTTIELFGIGSFIFVISVIAAGQLARPEPFGGDRSRQDTNA